MQRYIFFKTEHLNRNKKSYRRFTLAQKHQQLVNTYRLTKYLT